MSLWRQQSPADALGSDLRPPKLCGKCTLAVLTHTGGTRHGNLRKLMGVSVGRLALGLAKAADNYPTQYASSASPSFTLFYYYS